MPSSISNFEMREAPPASFPTTGYKHIGVMLSIVCALLLSFEVVTRVVIDGSSKVQREVNREYDEAISIRQTPASGTRQLLIVGNSLVGHGIDMPELRRNLAPNWQAHEFWIYNTGYTDWYFGLRRLFAAGSRPDVVAIVFAAMHWNGTGIRGDYSSQYLFDTRDLPAVQKQLDLDMTATSGLLLSRFSKAYALRSETRKVLLDHILPDLPQMYNLFKPGPSRQISDQQVFATAAHRIAITKQLAHQYGVRLALIVPPIPPNLRDHAAALKEAAATNGVPILIPLTGSNLPPSDFADDIHLTPAGATYFTAALSKAWNSTVSE